LGIGTVRKTDDGTVSMHCINEIRDCTGLKYSGMYFENGKEN